MSTSSESNDPKKKPPKTPGPIRWNAILPVLVFTVLLGAYFHFLFDLNIKNTLEWAGTKIVGAEVNIRNFKTSFTKASLLIQGIEVTDSEKPTHNSLKIGDIRFSLLWDALLRVKFVVNEAAVEQIEFGTRRARPGRVLPPPPPEADDGKPSLLETEGEKLKAEALKTAQEDYNENVLGDIATMLGGSSAEVPLDQLKDKLVSKKMADQLEQDLNSMQKDWATKLNSLPQGKDFQTLGDRLGKIKSSNFKNPEELAASLKDLEAVLKDGEVKFNQIQSAKGELDSDLKKTQEAYRSFEAQVRNDIKSLEKHFKIPQINAKSLTLALLKKHFAPYMAKINKYQALAKKYLPPNIMKKDKPGEPDVSMKAHPRQNGITYEFGRPNSYPLFWIKRISISSQAGATLEAGNLKGEILDLTSQQGLVGRPTTAQLKGDFPGMGIGAFQTKISFDNRKVPSNLDFIFKVGSYAVSEKPLVRSDDVDITMLKATGSLDMDVNLKGLKALSLNLQNRFSSVAYDIKAKNSTIQDILKGTFEGIPSIDIQARATGVLPDVPFDLSSNIGSELQKGFSKQIQVKIDEARRKLEALINSQISEQKNKIEAQINQFKGRIEREIKKLQDQAEFQKKAVLDKSEHAKKDAETQGRKKLESEGQKAVDDLKKRLGF